nr:DsbA family oxidoreductase [uncultured Carboxylicivirga sp.]
MTNKNYKNRRVTVLVLIGCFALVTSAIALSKASNSEPISSDNSKVISKNGEMEHKSNMLIEVWSDYLCPWCYIGESNLENAIKESGINAKVVYKSFQSNPTLKGAFTVSEIAQQSGFSLKQAQEKSKYIEKMAQASNVELHMDKVIMANTLDAHRLAFMAKQKGFGKEVSKCLFEASYLEAKNIADENVLADIGSEFGIEREEMLEMLRTDKFKEEIQYEIKEGLNNGLQGVPYFVINKKYSLSGAQPKETFMDTFSEIIEKDGSYTSLINKSEAGYSCDENGCHVPQK